MPYNIDHRDAERQFIQFLFDHGLREPRSGFLLDGSIHRCPVDGKRDNDTTGSYMYWPNGKSGDGRPHGWAIDMRDSSTRYDWQYKAEYTPLTPEERKAYAIRERKKAEDAENRRAEAFMKARSLYDGATAADGSHGYLVLKGISDYRGAIRQNENELLVPFFGISEKYLPLRTLQRIYPKPDNNGFSKIYFSGIPISKCPDAAFIIEGDISSNKIFIAEGMATAQSAASALNCGGYVFKYVFAAGDCSRLKGVCEAVRSTYPTADIFILADDDFKTFLKSGEQRKNPGLGKAHSLLREGLADGVIVPFFPRNPADIDDSANTPSDWNDYVHAFGIEAAAVDIKKQITLASIYIRQKSPDMTSLVSTEEVKSAEREARLQVRKDAAKTEQIRQKTELDITLEAMAEERGRPQILEEAQQTREAAEAVIRAMQNANIKESLNGGSPKYYVDKTSKFLVWIFKNRDNRLFSEEITTSTAVVVASDCADFWKAKGIKGGGSTLVPDMPSDNLLTHIVKSGASKWESLPQLKGVSIMPIIRPDGSIHNRAGYDPVTQIYYDERDRVVIPDSPTQEDAKKAAEAIYSDILLDFPFAGETENDKKRYIANTMAFLLSGALRDFGFELMPFGLIEAPRQSTGKTLLAQTISTIIGGEEALSLSFTKDTEENRKQLYSALMADFFVLFFDNLDENSVVRSTEFEVLGTSKRLTVRILGSNKMAEIENRSVMLMTGNNPRLGGSLPRRVVRIVLDDGRVSSDHPREFKHPERKGLLLRYVKEHRAEILGHIYTMIKAWFSAGRPKWHGRPLESYEEWSRIVGGILQFCGLNDFLKGVASDHQAMADEETDQWGAFIETIYREMGSSAFSIRTLAARCVFDSSLSETLPDNLGSPDEKRFAKTLSYAFRGYRNRVFESEDGGRLIIKEAGKDRHRKTALWQIVYMPSGNISPC